jgi:hypothetical protein
MGHVAYRIQLQFLSMKLHTTEQSQSQSYITTDGQSVSLGVRHPSGNRD